MNYSKDLLKTVKQKTERNLKDVERAVQEAEVAVRALPEFEDMVNHLVSDAIRSLVHAFRHQLTYKTKYKDIPSPRVNHSSPEVRRAHRSVWDTYCIGRTVLGEIMGSQIDGLIEIEKERSDGHLFNIDVLRWVKRQGVGNRKVREAIPERAMKKAIEKIRKKYQPDEEFEEV